MMDRDTSLRQLIAKKQGSPNRLLTSSYCSDKTA